MRIEPGRAAVLERDPALVAHRAFEAAPAPIVITDELARIVLVNEAFTRVTGYSAAEAVGRQPRILRSGRHSPEFYREMWGALASRGRWEGEIWNRRKSGEIYPEWLAISAIRDERNRAVNYVGVFTDISRRKQQEERLQYLSQHDFLTGLPNRNLFMDRLDRVIRRARRCGTQVAVLFIDLDAFKQVNDRLGHSAGDQVLQTVAERLREAVRDMDTVARIGGDEFAIVLPDLTALAQALGLAGRVVGALARPVDLFGETVTPEGSVGVSLWPRQGADPAALLERADGAMYRAKMLGGGRYSVAE